MPAVLIIDIIGIGVGLFAMVTVIKLNRTLGGRISKGLFFFNWGVLFQILAFVYTIIFTRLKLIGPPPIDFHHLLMAIGMILFVVAAKKFATLLQS